VQQFEAAAVLPPVEKFNRLACRSSWRTGLGPVRARPGRGTGGLRKAERPARGGKARGREAGRREIFDREALACERPAILSGMGGWMQSGGRRVAFTGTNACAARPGCARLHRLTIGAQDTILPHIRWLRALLPAFVSGGDRRSNRRIRSVGRGSLAPRCGLFPGRRFWRPAGPWKRGAKSGSRCGRA
jgi:hypothetical protein